MKIRDRLALNLRGNVSMYTDIVTLMSIHKFSNQNCFCYSVQLCNCGDPNNKSTIKEDPRVAKKHRNIVRVYRQAMFTLSLYLFSFFVLFCFALISILLHSLAFFTFFLFFLLFNQLGNKSHVLNLTSNSL